MSCQHKWHSATDEAGRDLKSCENCDEVRSRIEWWEWPLWWWSFRGSWWQWVSDRWASR